jgi:hypothetical protein
VTSKVKKEVERLIKKLNLKCSLEQFRDKAYWPFVSTDEILSEDFIREFKDKVIWGYICNSQDLSECFVYEFRNKIFWGYDNLYKNLSQGFIYRMNEEGLMNEYSFDNCLRRRDITEEYIEGRKVEVNRFEIMDFED